MFTFWGCFLSFILYTPVFVCAGLHLFCYYLHVAWDAFSIRSFLCTEYEFMTFIQKDDGPRAFVYLFRFFFRRGKFNLK